MMSMLIIMIMMIILVMIIKIAKAHSIWVFEVGTCRGHKPIIDQSCGAVNFPVTQLCPKYWPTLNRLHQVFFAKVIKLDKR